MGLASMSASDPERTCPSAFTRNQTRSRLRKIGPGKLQKVTAITQAHWRILAKEGGLNGLGIVWKSTAGTRRFAGKWLWQRKLSVRLAYLRRTTSFASDRWQRRAAHQL